MARQEADNAGAEPLSADEKFNLHYSWLDATHRRRHYNQMSTKQRLILVHGRMKGEFYSKKELLEWLEKTWLLAVLHD